MNAHSEAPYLASSTLEKLLEHRFIAGLATHLGCRGTREFDVLHSEVDAFGHDIVLECQGAIRHIQLKAMVREGMRRESRSRWRGVRRAASSGCTMTR